MRGFPHHLIPKPKPLEADKSQLQVLQGQWMTLALNRSDLPFTQSEQDLTYVFFQSDKTPGAKVRWVNFIKISSEHDVSVLSSFKNKRVATYEESMIGSLVLLQNNQTMIELDPLKPGFKSNFHGDMGVWGPAQARGQPGAPRS